MIDDCKSSQRVIYYAVIGTGNRVWYLAVEHCQDLSPPVSEPEDGQKLMKIGGPEEDSRRLIRR